MSLKDVHAPVLILSMVLSAEGGDSRRSDGRERLRSQAQHSHGSGPTLWPREPSPGETLAKGQPRTQDRIQSPESECLKMPRSTENTILAANA